MGPKGTTELVATISLEPEPSLACAISASSGRRKARCALRLSPRSSRALLSRLGSSASICYTGFCSDAPHFARSCCPLRPAAGFLRSSRRDLYRPLHHRRDKTAESRPVILYGSSNPDAPRVDHRYDSNIFCSSPASSSARREQPRAGSRRPWEAARTRSRGSTAAEPA